MIGIIGAMRVEIEALKNSLEEAEIITISGIDYYRGMLDGQKVVAAVSGVGKVFAAGLRADHDSAFRCGSHY